MVTKKPAGASSSRNGNFWDYVFLWKREAEASLFCLILRKYFSVTKQPKEGDLVVYYSGSVDTHYDIYVSENVFESKWGGAALPIPEAPPVIIIDLSLTRPI
ncbi:MAG: hypothetical protein BGO67_06885 [Alphaproteobacteria bacterium 41-28]|nr:MAG: hypothetical protein BGO67_06885 [Alphaproteobacteria bacterium 41-28]